MKTIPHLFADATAMLEDAIAITVEGQCRDNSQDMQRALTCHLRMAIAAMSGIVGQMKHQLGKAHD